MSREEWTGQIFTSFASPKATEGDFNRNRNSAEYKFTVNCFLDPTPKDVDPTGAIFLQLLSKRNELFLRMVGKHRFSVWERISKKRSREVEDIKPGEVKFCYVKGMFGSLPSLPTASSAPQGSTELRLFELLSSNRK